MYEREVATSCELKRKKTNLKGFLCNLASYEWIFVLHIKSIAIYVFISIGDSKSCCW